MKRRDIYFTLAFKLIEITANNMKPKPNTLTKYRAKQCFIILASFGSKLSNNSLMRYLKDHSKFSNGKGLPGKSLISRCMDILLGTEYEGIKLIRNVKYGHISNFKIINDKDPDYYYGQGKDPFRKIDDNMKLLDDYEKEED